MHYIIASHGKYAEYTKKSCEMIVGETKKIEVVTFIEEMSLEDLILAYTKILEGTTEEVIIITDIVGGSPYNAAIRLFEKEDRIINVVAGLSLAMLIPLALDEPLTTALQATKDSITTYRPLEAPPQISNETTESMVTPNHQTGIVHVRIDERLIHGQVATMWTGEVKASRIIVVDNNSVNSEMEKSALRSACPKNVHLSILTIENAAKRIKAGTYANQRVLLLAKTPETIQALLDLGVSLKAVNIGNMSKKDNRKQLKKSVYITEEELSLLKKMAASGIKVTTQMVPSEEIKEINDYHL